MTTIHQLSIAILLTLCSSILYGQTPPPPTTNACIGAQGALNWYYWQQVERTTLDHLYASNNYPQGPSGMMTIPTPDTPRRFDDYMGSVVKGYMTVPVTGKYAFNIMGDDRVDFYLSTDDLTENKVLEVSLTGVTGRTGYYARPESHSDTLDLIAGTYYYFELHHKEATGDDYARLFWHTPMMADSTWQIVPVNHVYQKLCETVCLPMGTPCDDGDANTTNDREDGACNCIGDQPAVLGCAGRQGVLQALTWRGIAGSSLNNLYTDPRYPLMPDTVEFVKLFNHLSTYNTMPSDEFGQVIKGYMTVPVTGDYQFNMTADDRGLFFLSTDEEPFNMQQRCNTVNANGIFEHDEHPEQTSSLVSLVAGQYYYFEIHYKENSNTNRFYIYWKTPYHGDDHWRVVPMTYIYEYDCETACLPDGTPCDDKDAGTFGDVIAGCMCAGTSCPGGDCTELETYTPYDACAYTDQHSIADGNSWVSCSTSPNPNTIRGDSHWILYDFNSMYQFNNSTFYNYNAVGATGQGVKDIVIDYSVNGTEWVELGAYQVPQASGLNSYSGVLGPALDGIAAQYLLITVLTNWDNGACVGISELIFEATTCPDAGTLCDDGDANTTDDRYDSYCHCAGLDAPTNDCEVEHLVIGDDPAQSKTYSAIESVTSDLTVDQYANTNFVAGGTINLLPGFETKLGANFLATIIPCTAQPLAENNSNQVVDDEHKVYLGQKSDDTFVVFEDAIQKLVYVKLEQKGLTAIRLRWTNFQGEILLEKTEKANDNLFEDRLSLKGFPQGVYTLTVEGDGIVHTKRIVIHH